MRKATGWEVSDLVIIPFDHDRGLPTIMANETGRDAIEALTDISINWEFGSGNETVKRMGAPEDWRMIVLDVARLERDGRIKLASEIENAPNDDLALALRVALAAKEHNSEIRAVVHDGEIFRVVKFTDDSRATLQ